MKHVSKLKLGLILCGLSLLLLSACGGGSSPGNAPKWEASAAIPVAGPTSADTPRLDGSMTALMKKWSIPGMSLAISKNGKLIMARGYGYADVEARTQMQPDTRGRYGSISKTITAVALLHLVEQGKLDLDTPFLNILTQYPLPSGGDPRMRTVTVRQIMWHTGGWETSVSGDPEMMSTEIAKALGVAEPTNCGDWIRYKLTKPLDFNPGSKYSYSNFGYCVLSRVIEQVTGENYYEYVTENVLHPIGDDGVVKGYTLEAQRQAGEVKYYDYSGGGWIPSLLPPHASTPAPYGWAQIEALEGMGGWIGSAVDLTRFMNSIDGGSSVQFLQASSVAEFVARPQIPGADTASGWYGLGIAIGQLPDGLYWNHNGGCPGTVASISHRPDGYDWAVVLNSRPKDAVGFFNELLKTGDDLINVGLADSASDLYTQFPSNP